VSTSAATPRPGARRKDEAVPSITSAPEALEADQARRMRRYLFQMGFRVVCFLGAYLASGWLRWTLVVFAVVIPYIAVILVNAGRDRVQYDTHAVVPEAPRQLPPMPEGAHVVVDPDARETGPDGGAAPTTERTTEH
jgi:hypothetical protein